MNINKYIKWDEIWTNEIDIQTSIDCLDENDVESIAALQQLIQDTEISLLSSECEVINNNLIFCFSETGGQNESDNQGWDRMYTITVDSDFMIIDAEYSQG